MSLVPDSDPDALYDPGLQTERTLLAWQRTVLAVAVSSLVAIRFTTSSFGGLAAAAGIVGLGLAAAAYVWAHYRYRHTHTTLNHSGALPPSSAWPLASLAAATLLLGFLAVLYLVGSVTA